VDRAFAEAPDPDAYAGDDYVCDQCGGGPEDLEFEPTDQDGHDIVFRCTHLVASSDDIGEMTECFTESGGCLVVSCGCPGCEGV
jgi:hypothetical protein